MSWSAVMVTLTGLFAVGVVFAFGLSREVELAALLGAVVSTVFGLVALFQKARTAEGLEAGPAGVKQLLSAQVVSLMLRLAGVLVGGFAVKRQGLEPIAYVLAFFACYVVQQLIEMRFVLAANRQASAVEARS
ncbi:MAG: hypothetical protein IAE78_27620 [Myxococcus sp.]|nr:hypothetical protein [Myxococcus sp.]